MTKLTLNLVSVVFLFALFNAQHSLCADSPKISPSPSPEFDDYYNPSPPADGDSPSASPSQTPSSSPLASSPLASSPLTSPPSPPTPDFNPETSPSPSPTRSRKSLSPSPSPRRSRKSMPPSPSFSPSLSPVPAEADVSHDIKADDEDSELHETSDDDELKASQKVGIAFGVIGVLCVAGLGFLVYKKRQQNIRRAQLGYNFMIEMH